MASPTSNSVIAYYARLSGDPDLDALLVGTRWGTSGSPIQLQYSFPTASSSWLRPTYSDVNEPFNGFSAFTPLQAQYARQALSQWSHYANISFVEVNETSYSVGDIRFGWTRATEDDELAHAYFPYSDPAAGDIWFSADARDEGFQPGSYGYFTLLHEIGHALGLKHPFEASDENSATLNPSLDSASFTVMAYDAAPGYSYSDYFVSTVPTTPMPLDIIALQYLYGENTTYNSGDNEYVFNQGADYLQTIYDRGGNDTIRWNGTTQGAMIDLVDGNWSALGNPLTIWDDDDNIVSEDELTVNIFVGTIIENAVGGASNDYIYGNSANNRLDGAAGHDYLLGDAGSDTLEGGEGNDHLYGQSPDGGTDGSDTLRGGGGNDYLQGNAGDDQLDGGEGSDRINGGAANDVIYGGNGNGNDTINGNLGEDRIEGGAGNNALRGGQGADTLIGGQGNDRLSGDLGADRLSGGDGIDIFTFSGAGSASGAPDIVTDYVDGVDRLSIGFAPTIVLTGAPSSAAAAVGAAQQLMNDRVGDGEVVALQVGSDSYLLYSSSAGATIDSAIILSGASAGSLSAADFG